MTVAEFVVNLVVVVGFLSGWLLYVRERGRSRDYATDLVQLMWDYDLGREDLRRSLGHDEIEEEIERVEAPGSGERLPSGPEEILGLSEERLDELLEDLDSENSEDGGSS